MSLGIVGLVDALRHGRPRQADSSTRSTIIRLLSQNPPHRHGWNLRDLSKATGLPLTTVHRITKRVFPGRVRTVIRARLFSQPDEGAGADGGEHGDDCGCDDAGRSQAEVLGGDSDCDHGG